MTDWLIDFINNKYKIFATGMSSFDIAFEFEILKQYIEKAKEILWIYLVQF